jgi:hypothetical protein
MRNHSLVALNRPGRWRSTSSTSLSLGASGSFTLITMIFQSVSSSSSKAMTPSTLTWMTSPGLETSSPISQTSNGSLSPFALVSGWTTLGSSHVCESYQLFVRYREGRRSYLGKGTVVPEVALVREAVPHVAELALLDVLLDGVERLLLGNLHLGIGPAGHLKVEVQGQHSSPRGAQYSMS